jgi:hypothetical protein
MNKKRDGYKGQITDTGGERWDFYDTGAVQRRPIDEGGTPRFLVPAGQKRGGGPKTRHDYEGALIDVFSRIYKADLRNPTEKIVADAMQDWLTDNYIDGGPDRRELLSRARRLLDALDDD